MLLERRTAVAHVYVGVESVVGCREMMVPRRHVLYVCVLYF